MASASQPPNGRDGVLSTLDVIIQGLNLVKDTCGIPPAQAAIGTVSALLTMMKVRFLLFRDEKLLVHVHPGLYGQRTRLYRPRAVLRRCMPSPRQGIAWETNG